MKVIFFFALLTAILSCNDQKEKKDSSATKNSATTNTTTPVTTQTPATGNENPPNSTGGTGLVGTWKMDTEIFDDNGNRVIDEEERNKAYGNRYQLQLNDDATCRIQGMFSGHWKTKNENGYPMLYVYRNKVEGEETTDPPPDIFGIVQMDATDLILQVMMAGEPSSFWLFKRQ